MKYIKNTLDFRISEPSVISLGKFDGLHMGHRYLMEEMEKGKNEGLKSVVFTFDIPPKSIHQKEYKVLSTNEEKAQIFSAAGGRLSYRVSLYGRIPADVPTGIP